MVSTTNLTYSKKKVSVLKKLELKCKTRHELTGRNTKYRRSMIGVGTAHQQHEIVVAILLYLSFGWI